MSVAKRHLDRRMTGELLDRVERDAADCEPRAERVSEVVEPKVLDLRSVDGAVERVLDIGHRVACVLSFQVYKDVTPRAGLAADLLQLLQHRVVKRQVVWATAVRLSMRTIRRLKSI